MTTRLLQRCKSYFLPLAACALLAPAVYALSPDQGAASTGTPPTPAVVPGKTPPLPLLWKVSDKDNALYLLGSFHLLKADDYPLSEDVDQAFDASQKVVFEVPPADLADPATALKMQAAAGYGDDRTLSAVLPPALHEKLRLMLGAERTAALEGFEPWFINLSLLMGVSQSMGFQAEQGLDQELMRRAAVANKPTAGLESIDEQLQVLDSTPIGEQVEGLQEFLDNTAEMPGMLGSMHDAWRDADVARLTALAVDEMRTKTPESYRLINVERNDAWLPQLQKLLDKQKRGDTLVVVGAMHLLGSDGLVEKLRVKGYTVERICSACDLSDDGGATSN